MATLDIRNHNIEQTITAIKYEDESVLSYSNGNINAGAIDLDPESTYMLCEYENIDNLIAALQKAKELWAPK